MLPWMFMPGPIAIKNELDYDYEENKIIRLNVSRAISIHS